MTNLSGREKVIHSFSGSPDGDLPIANLVEAKGTLYGTTYSGGSYTSNCRQNSYVEGCGTVFSIKPWGKEKVILVFSDGGASAKTHSMLPDRRRRQTLRTANGGKDGFGIVFSLKPSGRFTILHNFRGTLDGSGPYGRLTQRQWHAVWHDRVKRFRLRELWRLRNRLFYFTSTVRLRNRLFYFTSTVSNRTVPPFVGV